MEAVNELIGDILDVVIERVVISEPDPGTKGRVKGVWYRRKNGLVRKWLTTEFSCRHGRWTSGCKLCNTAKSCPPGQKVCAVCGHARDVSEFLIPPRNKEGTGCRTCHNQRKKSREQDHTKNSRRRKHYKELRASFMSQGCCIPGCFGKDDPHMIKYGEFDHIENKRFGMAKWANSVKYTEEDLLLESLKCRPICRFHHKLHSAYQRSLVPQKATSSYQVGWKRKRRVTLHSENNKIKRGIGACVKCGRVVKAGQECGFDWDHTDPSNKKYDVSRMIMNCNAWETILAEIDKCVLKCACCHAEEPTSRYDFSN